MPGKNATGTNTAINTSAVAMIALYTVGLLGDRRRSLVVGAGSAVFLVAVIAWIETTGEVTEGALRLLLVLSALVVGDTVRSRRALRAAMAEEERRASRQRLDEERLRVARELHDTVAHALVAINVRAGVAARLQSGGDEALNEIKDVSAEALRDLRSTLDLLREQDSQAPTRPAQDLHDLGELFERARAGGLETQAEIDVGATPIASPVGQAGFRIVQESLTNVLRHAHATRARVGVQVSAGVLEIDVVDDGRGAPGAVARGAGHGLRGMAERAGALGGRVDAGPASGGGWRVHAELPLNGA